MYHLQPEVGSPVSWLVMSGPLSPKEGDGGGAVPLSAALQAGMCSFSRLEVVTPCRPWISIFSLASQSLLLAFPPLVWQQDA